LVFSKFWAGSYYIAVFGAWSAAFAVGYFAPFRWYAMGVGVVGSAYAAVHSAWSHKFRREFGGNHNFVLATKALIVLRFSSNGKITWFFEE
jgi:hypothetical protein